MPLLFAAPRTGRCATAICLMKPRLNEKGFTFIVAIFMVTIMGILSVSTGKSWMLVMKREREKELLFRGSQIKEAIENWYNPKYIPGEGPEAKQSPR